MSKKLLVMIKTSFVTLLFVLILTAQAQGVQNEVFVEFEEIAFEPGSVVEHGPNLFIFDAVTVIGYSGDWVGEAIGLCDVAFHSTANSEKGNLHCQLEFTGTILGEQGTVNVLVVGQYNDSDIPPWTGISVLSNGTGELAHITGNLTFDQTGSSGTIEGFVIFHP